MENPALLCSDSDSDLKDGRTASQVDFEPLHRSGINLSCLPLPSFRTTSQRSFTIDPIAAEWPPRTPELPTICFLTIPNSEDGISTLKSPTKLRAIAACNERDPGGLFIYLWKKAGVLVIDAIEPLAYMAVITAAYAPGLIRGLLGGQPALPAPGQNPPQVPHEVQRFFRGISTVVMANLLSRTLNCVADFVGLSLATTLQDVLVTKATRRQAMIVVVNTTLNHNFLLNDSSCFKGEMISTFEAVGPAYEFNDTEGYWVGVWTSGSNGRGAASAIQVTRQKTYPTEQDVRFVVASASPLVGENTTLVSVNNKTAKQLADENDSSGYQIHAGTSPDGKTGCYAMVNDKTGYLSYVLVELYDMSRGRKVL